MQNNEKILARLAGREPEHYCERCNKSFYEEECEKLNAGISSVLMTKSKYLCPECKCRTSTRDSRLVNRWAKRYFKSTQAINALNTLNNIDTDG